jgi:hypothetical protein
MTGRIGHRADVVSGWRRLGLLSAIAIAISAATTSAASAQTAPIAAARLQGSFALAGRVTVAVGLRSEHAGETVHRVWTLTPTCAAGPCATVQLLRRRARGSDTLLLHELAAGYYAGSGFFYAPLQCGPRRYRKGELVPFAVTVRITTAIVVNGVVLAGRVSATYRNPSRTNLTPCVDLPGHDAATYHGHIIAPPPARTSRSATIRARGRA